MQEANSEEIRRQCNYEFNKQIEKLCVSSKKLISLFNSGNYIYKEHENAREEAKSRLRFFKHIIEECDGYKNLYFNDKPIAKENDLQRMFRLVWYGTNYIVDAEPNNGRGQADFIVSYGSNNQNIIEFKLASNTSLEHVFTQVQIYEAANCTEGSLIAIFYFTMEECIKAQNIIKVAGYEELINNSIFLVDCRNDNKPSASIVKNN